MPGLKVRLLGPFEVEGLDPHRLGPPKARTLLKMLALARGKPVTADYLIDCLWPEGPPARPSSRLAVLVSRLRSTLGSELARTDAGDALAMDWLDVDAVAELADEADRRLAVGGPSLAKAAATAALALVRGPLLADELEAPWAEPDRAAVGRLVARVRDTAAEAALATGAWADAAELGRQTLEHDPYDEAALRVVMAALASSGRHPRCRPLRRRRPRHRRSGCAGASGCSASWGCTSGEGGTTTGPEQEDQLGAHLRPSSIYGCALASSSSWMWSRSRKVIMADPRPVSLISE